MAKIVKLADLLPEDIVFELPGGQRYTLPGDPPLELILRIAGLFERTQNEPGTAEGSADLGLDILQELDALALQLLRMCDPSVEHSPFGALGIQHVVSKLLAIYNFGAAEEPDTVDPPKPAGAKKKRSRSSTGSRSS